MKTALLIPIYQPNEKVLPFLSSFGKGDFDFYLVVDDGSGKDYQSIFERVDSDTNFKVFSYPENHGKGYALKQGIKKLWEEHPDLDYIVTADGDGQHLRKDILNIKNRLDEYQDALVLGSRDFSLPDVPKRSRQGNHISSFAFRLLTGKKLQDTQTGLRAIPKKLFPLALEIEGSRYEYENNFLIAATKESEIIEINIETVYEDNNAESHFRPFRDSILVMKKPLLYILASLASFLLDLGLFSLFVYVVFQTKSELFTALSTVLARIASGIFNFLTLRYVVFKEKQNTFASAIKYLLLYLVNMALSAGITAAFTYSGTSLAFLKVLIDAVIAVANYFINRLLVFKRSTSNKKERK